VSRGGREICQRAGWSWCVEAELVGRERPEDAIRHVSRLLSSNA